MRNSASLSLMLALCLSACGDKSEPAPAATESAAAATAAAAAEPPTTPPAIKLSGTAQVPTRLRALGTEPFWGVQIDGTKLIYTTPEDQKGTTIIAVREDSPISGTWIGKLDGKPFELSIVPEKCSDGMSDNEYSFSAWLKIGSGMMHHGCAKSGG